MAQKRKTRLTRRKTRTLEVTPVEKLVLRPTPIEEMGLPALDTFEYEFPGNRIEISFTSSEFTAICPFSDFPDFATLNLRYVPNKRCIELKSLKRSAG